MTEAELPVPEGGIKLVDLMPNAQTGPLQMRVEYSADIPISGKKTKKVIARNWKVKDYGKFKRLAHDRRLPNLFQYIEAPYATFEFIQYQLECYDRVRDNIFQLTFELERRIGVKYGDKLKEISASPGYERSYPEVPFADYVEVLEKQALMTTAQLEELKNIRNKFSHSQFPDVKFSELRFDQDKIDAFDKLKGTPEGIKSDEWSIAHDALQRYKKLISAIRFD